MQQTVILLRGLPLFPNSTGGLVKDITFPGSSLCCATYADCLSAAINPCVSFRKLVGSVSNRFICIDVSFTGSGTDQWDPRSAGKGYLIWGLTDLDVL